MLNRNSLWQLKKSVESGSSDRHFLAHIARGCSVAKVIGAQEAVSHLLGYPLVFQSSRPTDKRIELFLHQKGALNTQKAQIFPQKQENRLDFYSNRNILPNLDVDQQVSDVIKRKKSDLTLDKNLRVYIHLHFLNHIMLKN